MPPPANAPDTSPFALRGRLVTLDPHNTVVADGVLYIRDRVIEAVQPAGAPAPPGFEDIVPVVSGGTIYPGLIELHNHLPYDVLQLWPVPKKYSNRSQWGGSRNPDYHRLVTGPMTVLGEDPRLMPAVVRYVEAKALVNGTTTSQGIALFSNAGARRMYRGIVRNVEQTDDPALPEAGSRIADVEAVDAARFLARLRQPHRLLLHLAEGTDAAARAHFQALEFQPGQWAITENLVGIHCTALTGADFRILADHGGSMVWSPLSNLLLYGKTADIAAAKQAGVLIGLGSDWAISGSKGLLGELKAARLASDAAGGVFSDRELVAMATRDAATILQWDQTLGSLRPGMRADLLTISGAAGDPYGSLIDAGDEDIRLVTIDGVARYGTRRLMTALAPGAPLEDTATGAPADHVLNLQQDSADPIVAGVTLAEATSRLSHALHDLPALAARAAQPRVTARPDGDLHWQLALDEIRPTGAELRPRLALRGNGGQPTGPQIATRLARQDRLVPLSLDGLTASSDTAFLALLADEPNLPDHFGAQLSELLT
ncbi:amidohydrolase family protein [Streptomyces sp. SID13666]|uniref:amidohydrolase family protein n=1 Tax=unclassified Streptomyces TaxID=2593676 RepID=UPI0013C1C6DC|nr:MULTISPECIES: amidohydrolase family protein [unclassified Streptomyces]NEA53252.1 amidohydrolase family protein [Streptomyces sp. SID13666]NEA69421.1 amidohydrolase family protein [Streptomyces sp. SID13588]